MTKINRLIVVIGLTSASLVGAAVSAPAALNLGADATGAPEPFHIISERNIFDPNRGPAVPTNVSEPLKVEYITLKGTLIYAGRSHAFFEGDTTSKGFESPGPKDFIAGCRVLAIASGSVKITTPSGRVIDLAVGGRIQRTGDGEWEPSAAESNDTVKQGPARRRGQQ